MAMAKAANPITSLDAAMTMVFHIEAHRPGTSEFSQKNVLTLISSSSSTPKSIKPRPSKPRQISSIGLRSPM